MGELILNNLSLNGLDQFIDDFIRIRNSLNKEDSSIKIRIKITIVKIMAKINRFEDLDKWISHFEKLRNDKIKMLNEELDPMKRKLFLVLVKIDQAQIDYLLIQKLIKKTNPEKIKNLNKKSNITESQEAVDLFTKLLELEERSLECIENKANQQEKMLKIIESFCKNSDNEELIVALAVDYLDVLDVRFAASKIILTKLIIKKLIIKLRRALWQTVPLRDKVVNGRLKIHRVRNELLSAYADAFIFNNETV